MVKQNAYGVYFIFKSMEQGTTFRILELALYHSLAKLPEPELTHEFF